MPIPMQELVEVLGQDKAFELVRRFKGDTLPAASCIDKYARDEDVRRLWRSGLPLPDISDRLGITYITAWRAVRQCRN